eukprot:m51a1_g12939 hypothetical protein (624) ;mRNA; r:207-2297
MALVGYLLGVFTSSQARLLRLCLNASLRPYLKTGLAGDVFRGGDVLLEDVALDEGALNAKLGPLLAPLAVAQASVARLEVRVPWARLGLDSVRILASGLHLRLCLCGQQQQQQHEQQQQRGSDTSDASEELLRQLQLHRQAAPAHSRTTGSGSGSGGSCSSSEAEDYYAGMDSAEGEHETLASLEALFEHLFDDLVVDISDACISLEPPHAPSPLFGADGGDLCLYVSSLSYCNPEPGHQQQQQPQQPQQEGRALRMRRKLTVGEVNLVCRPPQQQQQQQQPQGQQQQQQPAAECVLASYTPHTGADHRDDLSLVVTRSPDGVVQALALDADLAEASVRLPPPGPQLAAVLAVLRALSASLAPAAAPAAAGGAGAGAAAAAVEATHRERSMTESLASLVGQIGAAHMEAARPARTPSSQRPEEAARPEREGQARQGAEDPLARSIVMALAPHSQWRPSFAGGAQGMSLSAVVRRLDVTLCGEGYAAPGVCLCASGVAVRASRGAADALEVSVAELRAQGPGGALLLECTPASAAAAGRALSVVVSVPRTRPDGLTSSYTVKVAVEPLRATWSPAAALCVSRLVRAVAETPRAAAAAAPGRPVPLQQLQEGQSAYGLAVSIERR